MPSTRRAPKRDRREMERGQRVWKSSALFEDMRMAVESEMVVARWRFEPDQYECSKCFLVWNNPLLEIFPAEVRNRESLYRNILSNWSLSAVSSSELLSGTSEKASFSRERPKLEVISEFETIFHTFIDTCFSFYEQERIEEIRRTTTDKIR